MCMWIYNCICTIILYIYKYLTFFFKGVFNLFASLTDLSLGSNLGNSWKFGVGASWRPRCGVDILSAQR